MNRLSLLVLFATVVALPTFANPSIDIPVGIYNFHLGNADNGVDSELACTAHSSCTLKSTMAMHGPPEIETHPLRGITRLDQVPQVAIDALRVAVSERDKPVLPPDMAELMTKLRPMLAAHPRITGCWDLNDPTPGISLACTVTQGHAGPARLFMFYARVADCHEGMGFCMYVVVPLQWTPTPVPAIAPAEWLFADEADRSLTATVKNERGDRLFVNCQFGQPQTCAWSLSTLTRCEGDSAVVGLASSATGKFRVLARCAAPTNGEHLTTFKLDDRMDIERSMSRGGVWELSLPIDGTTASLRFDATQAANSIRRMTGCTSWPPPCARYLPEELRKP